MTGDHAVTDSHASLLLSLLPSIDVYHLWHLFVSLVNMLKTNVTIDGRIPASPGTYKTLKIIGYLPFELVQDFFHQP